MWGNLCMACKNRCHPLNAVKLAWRCMPENWDCKRHVTQMRFDSQHNADECVGWWRLTSGVNWHVSDRHAGARLCIVNVCVISFYGFDRFLSTVSSFLPLMQWNGCGKQKKTNCYEEQTSKVDCSRCTGVEDDTQLAAYHGDCRTREITWNETVLDCVSVVLWFAFCSLTGMCPLLLSCLLSPAVMRNVQLGVRELLSVISLKVTAVLFPFQPFKFPKQY